MTAAGRSGSRPAIDSKRLNSVNPLDPSDSRDIEIRLEKAAKRFSDYGRPLTVRQTPLTPPQLIAYMDEQRWPVFSESIVMMARYSPNDHDGIDRPSADARCRPFRRCPAADLRREQPGARPGSDRVINAIKPECGLFLIEAQDDGPIAVSLAVHDNDLAGILQVAVVRERPPSGRRQRHCQCVAALGATARRPHGLASGRSRQ